MARPGTRTRALAVIRHSTTIVFVAVACAWLLLLRPGLLGGPASYVIVSGESMLPSIHGSDLVVVRKADSYRVGDVVAYRIPEGEIGAGQLVIHRVVGGSIGAGYLVKGDNRELPDPWRPTRDEIAGKLVVVAPRVGLALLFLRAPLGLATLAGLLAFVFFAGPRAAPHTSSVA
jgi:signal peptidase I